MTADFTQRFTTWQMQCMSMIFGCFSRNLAITPPLAPFITLQISDVKLISLPTVDGTFEVSPPDQKRYLQQRDQLYQWYLDVV